MKRKGRPFGLPIPPQTTGVRAYEWLRDAIRKAILEARLKPGERLPSTRELARVYKLSRGTVVSAIDDLRVQGYVNTVTGSGTFVSEVAPDHYLRNRNTAKNRMSSVEHLKKSDFADRLTPVSHFIDSTSLAFRTNLPALDLFPTTLWAQIASRRLRQLTTSQLLGCKPGGYDPLRLAVAEYLVASRGVVCTEAQVVIVSGVQEALDLTARILLNVGDRVLMEDPGYQVAYSAFHAAGAQLLPIPVDERGAAPSFSDFEKARLLYLTPSHQFPTGVTMPYARRLEILNYAKASGTYIFEDDHDSEYRYIGNPIPAMQGLDTHGCVIFAGSFNKVLFPSLRMGYLVLPPPLVAFFEAAKALITRHHSVIEQAVVCDFIQLGHFERHLRRTRKIYAERLAALSHYAELHLADFLQLSKVEAGLQTVAWLKEGLQADRSACLARKRRIDVVPINQYTHTYTMPQGLQIGFAAVDEQAIKLGVLELRKALRAAASQ